MGYSPPVMLFFHPEVRAIYSQKAQDLGFVAGGWEEPTLPQTYAPLRNKGLPSQSLTARPWKYTETQKERIVFQPSFWLISLDHEAGYFFRGGGGRYVRAGVGWPAIIKLMDSKWESSKTTVTATGLEKCWLITMVSKSPNWGCSPSKWTKWLIDGGVPNHLLAGMILQVAPEKNVGDPQHCNILVWILST